MAADILEIFEAFRENKVMLRPQLTYAVLAVWNWSLLQFCLSLGGNHKRKLGSGRSSGGRSGLSGGKQLLDGDILAILITIVLQDIPFICLRLTLIFGYGVISPMDIFFTCKNSLVILLQLYRLLVLIVKKRPHYRRHSIFSMLPVPTPDSDCEPDKQE